MNKFYAYLLPVIFFVASFAAYGFMGNELILYMGSVLSLGWLNRIAVKFQHKLTKTLSLIFLILLLVWGLYLLLIVFAF